MFGFYFVDWVVMDRVVVCFFLRLFFLECWFFVFVKMSVFNF